MKQIELDHLHAHPDNPRLFLRDSVVEAIAAQIKDRGLFEERHAPHVRKVATGSYQIISGHQRVEAARRAEMTTVPCCVVEMNDEEALRELLLSNAQSDLAPLEIGIHVLRVVGRSKGGRGNKNGIAEYARKMGVAERTMKDWACAAQVAAKLGDQSPSLLPYTTSLSILHRTPEEDWPELVTRMLSGSWTKEQTERYVDVIKTLEMPAELAAIFPRQILLARYFHKHEFSQTTLLSIVKVIRDTEVIMQSHDGMIDAAVEVGTFRAYMAEHAQQMLDVREVLKYQREWLNEMERLQAKHVEQEQWHSGDWREHVDAIPDESLSLILTDPPYGIDYRSGRAVARESFQKIENDGYTATVDELNECFERMFPKLRPDSHVLCFCHWRTENEVRTALVDCGFQIRGSLVWVKDMQGSGDLNGSFASKHERIIHAVKGSPLLWQRDADVLEYPRVTKSIHPAEKPVALLLQLINATTTEGDVVADPFAGIASTMIAAKQARRQFWGCELTDEFFQAGKRRLEQEAQQL